MTKLNFENVDLGAFGIKEEEESALEINPIEAPLTASMSEAVKVNPDKQAHINKLSQASGVPTFAVEPAPEEVESKLNFDSIDLSGMSKRSPNTAEFLVDFNNASIAHDDANVLENLEKSVAIPTKNFFSTLGDNLGAGLGDIFSGNEFAYTQFDADDPRDVGRFKRSIQGMTDMSAYYESVKGFTDSGLSQEEAESEALKTMQSDIARDYWGKLSEEKAFSLESENEKSHGLIKDAVFGASRSLPGMLSGPAAPTVIYQQIAGSKYKELIDAGLSEEDASAGAKAAAGHSTLLEYAGNLLQLRGFVKGLRGLKGQELKQFGVGVLESVLGNAGEEYLQSFADEWGNIVAANPDTDGYEMFREFTSRISDIATSAESWYSAAVGGTMGFLFPLGGATVRQSFNLTEYIIDKTKTEEELLLKKSANEQMAINAISADSNESALRGRDVEKFKQFVEKSDGNNNTHVFIDGQLTKEYLETKGVEEIANDPTLSMLSNQVNEAEYLGGQVQVPIADFAAEMPGTEHYESLRVGMTLSDQTVSPLRQAQDQVEKTDHLTRMLQDAQVNVSEYVESQKIYDTVKQQLVDTGRVRPEQATIMAEVVPLWAAAKAKRDGKTVQQVYQDAGLIVEGPQTGEMQRLSDDLIYTDGVTYNQETGELERDANFEKMFGNTAIKKDGEPYVMWHGTSDPNFLQDPNYDWSFDTDRAPGLASSALAGLGIFLGDETIATAHTGGDVGTIHPFYVNIENPYITTSEKLEKMTEDNETAEAFKKRIKELGGHDGIIISDRGHVIAFESSQIKSATDNVGTFDPENPDVRYQTDDFSTQLPNTIAFLQDKMFANKAGKFVKVQTVRQVMKQAGIKQIEKELVGEVLDRDGFKGEKAIPFDDFKLAVEQELMPLEQIKSNTYADYGSDSIQFEYDEAETVIYNSPIIHGDEGHFRGDFTNEDKIEYEIIQIPGREDFVALDSNRPAGITGEELQQYVGTAGSQERVQQWVDNYENTNATENRAGLFGHVRRWDQGVHRSVAEIQSDFYQKNRPEQAVIDTIIKSPETDIQKKLSDRLSELSKLMLDTPNEIANDYVLAGGVAKDIAALKKEIKTINDSDHVIKEGGELRVVKAEPTSIDGVPFELNIRKNRNGSFIVSENTTGMYLVSGATRDGALDEARASVERAGVEELTKVVNKNTPVGGSIQDDLDGLKRVKLEVVETDLEDAQRKLKGIPSRYDRKQYEDYFHAIQEEKKIREKELPKTFTNAQKQFIAHKKNYTERIIREEVRQAAKDGKSTLSLPTPHTLATIEGYIEGGAGSMYEVTSASNEQSLEVGDEIEYLGDIYVVMEAWNDTIEVHKLDEVRSFSVDEWVSEEVEHRKENTIDEIPDTISAYDVTGEYYGELNGDDLANLVMDFVEQNELAEEGEDAQFVEIDKTDIQDEIESKFEDSLSDYDWHENIKEVYENVAIDRNEVVYISEDSYAENLPQPDHIEGVDKDEFEIDDLADEHQGIVRGYEKHGEFLKSLSPDSFGVVEDDQGFDWYTIDITPEQAYEPVVLFQPTSEDIDGVRGYYDPANSIIRLTESSNLSTFLHEFAHFMYEMEKGGNTEMNQSINNWYKRNSDSIAKEATTSVTKKIGRLRSDLSKEQDETRKAAINASINELSTFASARKITPDDVTTFINTGTTQDSLKDVAINTAVHEQFARGFETYLMEGKAPSIELRNAFRTMARWLSQIYQYLKGDLNVNLDAEMRQVFDRLLATEEQIAAAEARARVEPMFTDAAMAGMTEEEFQKYQKQQEKVKDVQSETLRDKMIKQLTRQTETWWKEEKQDIIDEQIDTLSEERVNIARTRLSDGDVKLDFATTKEMAGEEKVDKIGRKTFRLSPKLRGMTIKENRGLHPDNAAALFGYGSGSEMLDDLINAPDIVDVADTRAEEVMIERHGDIFTDGTIEKAADDAVKNEERGKLLLAELKALSKGTAIPTIDRKSFKDIAKERIGQLSFREIFPGKYRKAEIRAAQESATMLAEGNKEGAAAAKMRQVMNYYLGMEATEAKAGTMKIVDRMSRYNKKKVREEISKAGEDYMDQIDKILSRFEFRKSATLKQVESLNLWMKQKTEEEGDALVLSNAVLDEAYITHWKNIPYSDVQGVNDSVKNIEHVARYQNKITRMQEKLDYNTLVEKLVTAADDVRTRFKSARTDVVEGRKWGRWAMAQMTKIPYMMSWMDNGDRTGVWNETFYFPFNDAYESELKMWEKSAKPVMDKILGRSKAEMKRHNTKIFIPEIDDHLYGHQILAVALNTGNASNLRKLLLGEGWANAEDEASISFENPQLQAVLSNMTMTDWKLVQTVWDQMGTLYPELAEVHRKTTGLTPPEIEATPIMINGQTFKGGYYPVKYDPSRDHRASINQEKLDAETDSMFNNSASIQASVTAGATNERTGYYAPIRLSLDVVPAHFQETIHYITHHDTVRETNKLLRDARVAKTVKEKLGPEEFAQLKPWLNSIAKDGRETPAKMWWETILSKLRMGITLGVMGFKASTGIIQLSGMSNTVGEVGLKNVLQASRSILGSPSTIKSAWDFASENSTVLKHRTKTMDREIKNAMKDLENKRGILAATQEVSMKHIAYIQTFMVDLPSWHAAYIKKLDETGDEKKAFRYADWVVENVQGSGATKDMAAIMNGQSETSRMFTMFMTFFSSLWNMERDLVKGAQSGVYSKSTIAAKMMFMFAVPVLFEMLMRGDLGGEDQEPEEQLQKLLTTAAVFPIQSIPFIRDIANAVTGEFGYNITPMQQLLEAGTRTIPKIVTNGFTDEEITKAQIKGATKFTGASIGVPGINQAWATGEHLYEVIEEGEELTMQELLFGPRRDK